MFLVAFLHFLYKNQCITEIQSEFNLFEWFMCTYYRTQQNLSLKIIGIKSFSSLTIITIPSTFILFKIYYNNNCNNIIFCE